MDSLYENREKNPLIQDGKAIVVKETLELSLFIEKGSLCFRESIL